MLPVVGCVTLATPVAIPKPTIERSQGAGPAPRADSESVIVPHEA